MPASQPSKGDTIITTLSIYLHPASVPSKGLLYDVTLGTADGEIIVQGERDPEHVAARVLEDRNRGSYRLEVFAPSLIEPGAWIATRRYRKVSDAASKHTRETAKAGPMIVAHREFELVGKAAQEA